MIFAFRIDLFNVQIVHLSGASNGAPSVHKTAQYERLNQDPSDNEEEEDDILFIQEGTSSPQNGFVKPKYVKRKKDAISEHEMTVLNGDVENSELIDGIELQKARIRPASEVEIRVMKLGALTRTRIFCFVVTLMLALVFAVALIFVVPGYSRHRHPGGPYKETSNWSHTFDEYGRILFSPKTHTTLVDHC